MAENFIDFGSEGENVVPIKPPTAFPDFPQSLVTEKVIFLLDEMLFVNEDETIVHNVFFLLKSYFQLKKKICVKPPEFECLMIYNNNGIKHSYINTIKDIQLVLTSFKNYDNDEETEPLELDNVFNKLAELVELPDPETTKKGIPPPYVYHVIWLFNQNLFVPTLENTNSFDFLMMTPYFALDIIYFFDLSLENNQCESISQALAGLNDNEMGYFLPVDMKNRSKYYAPFAQALGHPLIRAPLLRAKYNILELGPKTEIIEKKENNEETQSVLVSDLKVCVN